VCAILGKKGYQYVIIMKMKRQLVGMEFFRILDVFSVALLND